MTRKFRFFLSALVFSFGLSGVASSHETSGIGLFYRGYLTDRNQVPLEGRVDIKLTRFEKDQVLTELDLKEVAVHHGEFEIALQRGGRATPRDQEWEIQISRPPADYEVFSPRLAISETGPVAILLFSDSMILRATISASLREPGHPRPEAQENSRP